MSENQQILPETNEEFSEDNSENLAQVIKETSSKLY